MATKTVWGACPAVLSYNGDRAKGDFRKESPVYAEAFVRDSMPHLKISASSAKPARARRSLTIDLSHCTMEVVDSDILYDDSGNAPVRIKGYWTDVLGVLLPSIDLHSNSDNTGSVYGGQRQYRYIELRLSGIRTDSL